MNKKRLLKQAEKSTGLKKKKKQNGNLSLPVSLPEEISNAMNCK